MNAKKLIFTAALGSSRRALITGFKQACRRRKRAHAPFYPARVSRERERLVPTLFVTFPGLSRGSSQPGADPSLRLATALNRLV